MGTTPTLRALVLAGFLTSLPACAPPDPEPDLALLTEQVRAAETSFARSMAERDLDAFASHLSADAVFMSGYDALRGKDAVVEGWGGYFAAPDAPFSWAPSAVQVAASGDLALSTGPVFSAAGDSIGQFSSIWRLEPDPDGPGKVWRVVFDR